jgi:hypothetical protein
MRQKRMIRKPVILFVFLIFPAFLRSQQTTPSAVDFHAEIRDLYKFHPPALTAAQRTEKSAAMDKLWAAAKAQPAVYLPQLRRELADSTNAPFFFFDGSQLLLTLSQDPADQKIASAALAHVDIHDATPSAYFYFVHNLAVKQNDTTAAAFNILSDPKFQVYVPQHALTLHQDFCLIYMLLPTDQNFWVQPAINRLHQEKDPPAQMSLVLLLSYAQSAAADKALRDWTSYTNMQPAQLTSLALLKLSMKKMCAVSAKLPGAEAATEQSLREARSARMKAVSDEALDDLNSYTCAIVAKRKDAAR